MTLLAPYATVEQYHEAIKLGTELQDAAIEERILSASRFVDQCTGGRDGRFNQVDAEVRYFDGEGVAEHLLYEDELRAINTVKVDTTGNGTYDTDASAVVVLEPHNAATRQRPYDTLRLDPRSGNTVLDIFTRGYRSIEVDADWGWPSVPTPVRDLAIMVAHDIAELMISGSTLTLQSIDIGVRLTPDTNNLMQKIASEYGAKVVIV